MDEYTIDDYMDYMLEEYMRDHLVDLVEGYE